jgi:hypothetical protein
MIWPVIIIFRLLAPSGGNSYAHLSESIYIFNVAGKVSGKIGAKLYCNVLAESTISILPFND